MSPPNPSSQQMMNRICASVAGVCSVPVGAIATHDLFAREARVMCAWLATKLIPGWTSHHIAVALCCSQPTAKGFLKEASSLWRFDTEWRHRSDQLLRRLRRSTVDHVTIPSPPPPRPSTSKDAPPIHDSENWGFSRSGRGYLEEQNAKFTEAMERAGFRKHTVGAEG